VLAFRQFQPGPGRVKMRIRGLIVCFFVVVLPAEFAAQGRRARSILFLDQSDLRGPFYGGFVIQPGVIGGDAATRALRIVDGEAISQFPVTLTNAVKPIFNWVDPKAVDVNGVMREAFDMMTSQAAARNVALYLKASLDPLRVRGDSIQLQQVILNLIVNAMDAMTEIPFGRTIFGRTAADGGGDALISISDSGPGMSSENQSDICDPFLRPRSKAWASGCQSHAPSCRPTTAGSGSSSSRKAERSSGSPCRYSRRKARRLQVELPSRLLVIV
jgi:Histidine kinase-, DNA gyrase B-, and HSP90-like ATPase